MTIISAQILKDSLSPNSKRLTTLELCYPRFIHPEFMTHRAFSRNASSSRAIPVERMIDAILENTAMPIYWGANQKGMQAGEEIDEPAALPMLVASDRTLMYGFGEYASMEDRPHIGSIGMQPDYSKEDVWLDARNYAIAVARAYHKAGYHKQIINRILEPFMHIKVVVSATEWDNFFHLRDHPDAEPHIAHLAREIKGAMKESDPVHLNPGDWHLPYVDEYGDIDESIKVSVARCARVSYLTHDGRRTTWDEDLALYNRLVGDPMHASPMEHQGQVDSQVQGEWMNKNLHGNFVGFIQYRKTLPGENYVEG